MSCRYLLASNSKHWTAFCAALLAKLQNTPQLKWTFKSCYRSPAVDIIYMLYIYKPHEIYRFLLCSPCWSVQMKWTLMNATHSRNAKRATHEYSSFFYPCAETSKLNMYIPCSIIHEPKQASAYFSFYAIPIFFTIFSQFFHNSTNILCQSFLYY